MKKLTTTVAVVSLVGTVFAFAGPAEAKADKVDICHLNGASDPIPTENPVSDPRIFHAGQIISVSAKSVSGHERHGDSANFRSDEAGLANIGISADNNGLTLWKQADCFITR